MFFNDYETAVMLDLKTRMSRLSNTGKPQEDFLYANINEFVNSDTLKTMKTAQDYFKNDNAIKDRKRFYIDRKGNQQEVTNLSNAKLAHPFIRKLTKQKVNYLLSSELSIKSDDTAFAEALGKYLNKNFVRMLKNVGKDSIINGIAWVQVYYSLQGVLSFKRIPSEEVIPFWADADHTVLEAVIRFYTIVEYLPGGGKKDVVKVEYHTTEGVWYYVKGDRGLEIDTDPDRGPGVKGHFVLDQPMTDAEGKPMLDEEGNQLIDVIQATWEKVPFIGFKYNSDEVSILTWTKPLIDDYDLNTSDTSNTLQDVPNSIKVVKNYDGTDKGEFVQNLNTFRTAFVSGDGDMTTVETRLDVAAIDSHLNRLRKDIYEAGNGVDTQELAIGNASGVALKFRYADLDGDIQEMANEFAASLDQLIWFVKVDMVNKGIGDFMESDYDIIFSADSIVNEVEVIESAAKSVGIISDETIVANHPWVTDTEAEMERLKKQKEEQMAADMALFEEQNKQFGTNKPTDNPDDGEDEE